MQNEFLPYDRALKLKQLGFDEPCFGYHYTLNGKDWKFADNHEYFKIDDQLIIGANFTLLAPLFQQAFRWFREEHDLHYQLVPFFSDKESHAVDYYLAIAQHRPPIQVNTFEEAELACLDKLIEIVETKQQENETDSSRMVF
jgi:hypothetical protein